MNSTGKIRDAAVQANKTVALAARYERLADAHDYLERHGSMSSITVRFDASAAVHYDKAVTEVEGQLFDWWRGKDGNDSLRAIVTARIKYEMDQIEKEILS